MDRDQQERRRRPPDTRPGGAEPSGSRRSGDRPAARSRQRPADRREPAGRERTGETRRRPAAPEGRKAPPEHGRRAPEAEKKPRQSGSPRREPPKKPGESQKKARNSRARSENARRRKQPPKQQTRRTPPKPLPRRRLLVKLATAAAVVLALILGMTIFFRVQEVRVTGNARYTAQEILDASGIEKGENLLSIGKSRAAGKILSAFPYVDQVQIGIKLPNTVNIDIVEVEASYAVEADDGWWLMDAGGKLLEPVESPEGYTRVTGISAEAPVSGGALKAREQAPEASGEEPSGEMTGSAADRAAAALEILKVLSQEDRTAQVTSVDVSQLYDIQVWYGEKYQVILSGPTELTYKTRYMVQAIEQLEQEGYRGGVLDLTFTEPGKASFIPW